jgi:hypothetical protein
MKAKKSKVNKTLIIEVKTLKERIRVYDFEVVPPVDFEMDSGFIIKWERLATKDDAGAGAECECLDYDHAYRNMEDIGVSKKLRKFVLRHL